MEGIYIIHTRESIKCKEKIYKIGCSYNLYKRIKQYPKNSKVLFLFVCNNSRDVESRIKKYFNVKFKQVTDYGSEYFEGDYKNMIQICNKKILDDNRLLLEKKQNVITETEKDLQKVLLLLDEKNKKIEKIKKQKQDICPMQIFYIFTKVLCKITEIQTCYDLSKSIS